MTHAIAWQHGSYIVHDDEPAVVRRSPRAHLTEAPRPDHPEPATALADDSLPHTTHEAEEPTVTGAAAQGASESVDPSTPWDDLPEHQQDPRSDDELAKAYLAGERRAFTEITRRHYPRLWWLAKKYCKSDHDADEILQESLLKASKNLHRFRGDCKLSTWLYRVVANTCYDFVHRRVTIPTVAMEFELLNQRIDLMAYHDPLLDHTTHMEVVEAVRELPTDQARAIMLVDFVGLDLAMVATIEKVQPGTIKSRRARARRTLRERLQHLHIEQPELDLHRGPG